MTPSAPNGTAAFWLRTAVLENSMLNTLLDKIGS